MRSVFYAYVAIVLVLSGCSSGKSTFERGNYYEAVITSVNRLRRNSDHKKSVETLRQAYPMAVAYYEERAKTSLASAEPFKWTQVVNAYTTINVMHDEIKRCPGALAVIPNPVNYYAKLQEAKQNAAEEHYAAGIVALQFGDRENAKKAYRLFQATNEYVPGYKEVNSYLEAALAAATVKVLVEPIPVHSKTVGVSAQFFNDKISEFVHGAGINEFVRFYTKDEAATLKLKPDHIVQLAFDDFTVGEVHRYEKEVQLTKDSVVLATYVTATTGTGGTPLQNNIVASKETNPVTNPTSGNNNTKTETNTNSNTTPDRDAEQRELAERERIAREQAAAAERERLAREAAERERIAREAAERERLARETAERERLAREAAERDRLAKEAAEKARVEREAAERAAKEAAEKAQAEKDAAERERLAREAAEKAQAERDAAERERLANEAAAKAQAEKEAADKALAEKERAEREVAEKAKAEKEKADREAAEKAKAEREKAEKEKAEKEKADKEKAQKERFADPSIKAEDTLNVKDPVTICHIPPGNPTNTRTLVINRSALQAHLGHGDSEGDCGGKGKGAQQKKDEKGQDSKPAEKNNNDKGSENKGQQNKGSDNKGSDKKGSGKLDTKKNEHALLLNANDVLVASVESDPSRFLRYFDIAGDTNKVYGTVKATLYHFRKTTTSKGVVSFRIVDAKTGALLTAEKLPGEYVWVSEWATFNGDERALSPEQLNLTKLKEQPAPPPQDLFIEFTRPIYDQITGKIREFYKGY